MTTGVSRHSASAENLKSRSRASPGAMRIGGPAALHSVLIDHMT
jgi:hypothetical protein